MPQLVVYRGLPGSGKSKKALSIVAQGEGKWVRVNRDSIRLMIHGEQFSPKFEGTVTRFSHAMIEESLRLGLNVIVDDTNLLDSRTMHLEEIARRLNAKYTLDDSFLDVPVDECIKRDLQRTASVGRDVIERMHADYWSHQPKPDNTGAHDIVIVDLDGTLAHTDLPYPQAYDRDYSEDDLDRGIYDLVSAYHANTLMVVAVSGREGTPEKREQTDRWLSRNHVPVSKLLMRKAGDRRDDAIVKKEIYLNEIQGKYRVMMVIDDRPRVTRMWRHELGLPVLQAGDGRIF
jgi:predicted kinase